MNQNYASRRHFLQSTGSAILAAPFVTSSLRAASPNGKLRHATFGAAGMAAQDILAMTKHPNWELAAVCDVDTTKFARMKQLFPHANFYQDWRELFAKEGDKIDSVNVSVADHMHGIIGLHAIEVGKHVYGQKPLAHNLYECRKLMLKAREKGVNAPTNTNRTPKSSRD
jgi:predicted dehydrogenase